MPASALWYLALAALVGYAVGILTLWSRRGVALALVGFAALTPVLLPAVRPAGRVAIWLPCPRNWGWLPAWLLRPSPLASLKFEVGGSSVKLCYGRPALRGRRMLGGSRVPYGRLWRTGANEPTTLISSVPLEVAGLYLPAGRSSIYTIPGPESWELILNAATSQWGLESEYTSAVRARELGRVILPSDSGTAVERFTIVAEPGAHDRDAVDLVLAWEHSRLRIPIRPSRAEPTSWRTAGRPAGKVSLPLRP
jgi:hypothetical protein